MKFIVPKRGVLSLYLCMYYWMDSVIHALLTNLLGVFVCFYASIRSCHIGTLSPQTLHCGVKVGGGIDPATEVTHLGFSSAIDISHCC